MSIQIDNLLHNNSEHIIDLTIDETIAINGGRSIAFDGGASEPAYSAPRYANLTSDPMSGNSLSVPTNGNSLSVFPSK